MTPETPEQLFDARLAADPGGPLLTYYDDATGERAELSAKSLANWIAKTHFFLLDECGLSLSNKAFVQMPGHWLAFGVVFGCWFAGLELTSDISTCDVAFVADEYVQDVLSVPANVGERIAVSLLPMARPGQPPPGWLDYATAVRPMPDAWPLVRSQAGASDLAQPATSRRDLTSLAREWAVARSLPERARVQVSTGWPDLAGMTATLLGPLAVGGSLVLTRNLSPQRQAAVARDERAMALD